MSINKTCMIILAFLICFGILANQAQQDFDLNQDEQTISHTPHLEADIDHDANESILLIKPSLPSFAVFTLQHAESRHLYRQPDLSLLFRPPLV